MQYEPIKIKLLGWYDSYKEWADGHSTKAKLVAIVLLSLPIVLYCREILLSGHHIVAGDYSYYLTQFEAIRKSILEYHQFPWWNPWVAGGTPLFGNIQAGVFSLDTLLVLPFGTVDGFKLARLMYLLIGFFGFRQLFISYFKTERLRATLLAYIWTFGSFLAIRMMGHNTFLLIELVPWILLFYLRIKEGRNWLWFALTTSLLFLSSPHYIALQLIIFMAMLFIFKGLRFMWNKHKISATFALDTVEFKNLLKAGAIIGVLCVYRLYYVFQFVKDYPRPAAELNEGSLGFIPGLKALFVPDYLMHHPPYYSFGWPEAVAYIGWATGIAFLITMYVLIRKKGKLKQVFNGSPGILILLLIVTFLIAMGNFWGPSPYEIIRKFPVFDGMRVAVRWLAWTSMIILLLLAAYRQKAFRRTINILLIISCIELFWMNSFDFSNFYQLNYKQDRSQSAQFEEMYKWQTKKAFFGQDENLYEGIINNYGQLIASDSLVFTAGYIPTSHCGENQGCPFVTGPAQVTYWSPNKIVLKRTNSGPIVLNMNPGQAWQVNGQYVFSNLKVTDTMQPFTINDPSQTITVKYTPKFSLGWWHTKLQQEL
jgi:hypothetical protein